jgi:hypothetical protein
MHDTEGETIDDVRRQRDQLGIQLGIQLAALRERLRLAMAVAAEAKRVLDDADRSLIHLDDALAALDAVPGDTSERP